MPPFLSTAGDRSTLTGPGLLVSVRTPDEALAAIAGGADVVDIKEPSRGPMGAADAETVRSIVASVASARPITVAGGELQDRPWRSREAIAGVGVVKVGLAGCRSDAAWPSSVRGLAERLAPEVALAVVAYADNKAADAPTAREVLSAIANSPVKRIVIDTFDKTQGDIVQRFGLTWLEGMVDAARLAGVAVVVAGGIGRRQANEVVAARPDLIGVRGAACGGDRLGVVSAEAVRALRVALNEARIPSGGVAPA